MPGFARISSSFSALSSVASGHFGLRTRSPDQFRSPDLESPDFRSPTLERPQALHYTQGHALPFHISGGQSCSRRTCPGSKKELRPLRTSFVLLRFHVWVQARSSATCLNHRVQHALTIGFPKVRILLARQTKVVTLFHAFQTH